MIFIWEGSLIDQGGRNMGYYMRYIIAEPKDVKLSFLESALKKMDSAYSMENVQPGPPEMGELNYGDSVYGVLEINKPGEEIFEEELEELVQWVQESKGRKKRKIIKILKSSKAIIAIQILMQDRDTEQTLQKIDPIWEWLFANYKGLMQADGEGYYDQSGLIHEVD
jgi:hypothetical protein